MTVKILGICGSPRHGATEYVLKEALEEAKKINGIETEFWTICGKKVSPCVECDSCINNKSLCIINDDFKELESKILEADGIIVASPTYDMSVSAQTSAIFNRTRPYYMVRTGKLRNKVGAGIACGGSYHGGQETTLDVIAHFFMLHEMLVTGGRGGSYNGGTVRTWDEGAQGAMRDEEGLRTARAVGIAVAEAAKIMKLGKEQLK